MPSILANAQLDRINTIAPLTAAQVAAWTPFMLPHSCRAEQAITVREQRAEVAQTLVVYELNLVTPAAHMIPFPTGSCFEPHGIDISRDGRTRSVTCAGGTWIYPIDVRTLHPDRPIITAPGPIGVAAAAPRQYARQSGAGSDPSGLPVVCLPGVPEGGDRCTVRRRSDAVWGQRR